MVDLSLEGDGTEPDPAKRGPKRKLVKKILRSAADQGYLSRSRSLRYRQSAFCCGARDGITIRKDTSRLTRIGRAIAQLVAHAIDFVCDQLAFGHKLPHQATSNTSRENYVQLRRIAPITTSESKKLTISSLSSKLLEGHLHRCSGAILLLITVYSGRSASHVTATPRHFKVSTKDSSNISRP